jgi:hypothetical protein
MNNTKTANVNPARYGSAFVVLDEMRHIEGEECLTFDTDSKC